MELALPLLPLIAPDVAPPIAYRGGDEPPRFVRAERRDHLVAAAVREAGRRGGARRPHRADRPGRDPRPDRAAAPAPGHGLRRDLGSPIQALTPRAAKGLEFDRVVLVEPARIAAGGIEGLRGLYVALTRATKTLVVVHAAELPRELQRV